MRKNHLNQSIWTAVVTPFHMDGKTIDFNSFERLIRHQEKVGNGILILGSTGESLLLSENERKNVLQFAVNLNLSTPLMVGTPNCRLDETLDFLSYANDFNFDAYLMTHPMYTRSGINGQTAWFQTLFDASKKPVCLYNNPGRTAGVLDVKVIQALENHKHFWAMKDSSGTIEMMQKYRDASSKMTLFCGDDNMFAKTKPCGAIGLISVLSNAWGAEIASYVQEVLNDDMTHSNLIDDVCKVVFGASNPIGIKAFCKDQGLIEHNTMRLPLSQDDFNPTQTIQSINKCLESLLSKKNLRTPA